MARLLAISDWLLALIPKPFCVGDVVGGDANLVFYGGIGGGIDLGRSRNDAVDVVVAVENRWFLSHLQHLVDVKVREILTPDPFISTFAGSLC